MAAISTSLVLTTCSSSSVRSRLIHGLLEARLAACIQVLPVSSHYVWKGKKAAARESLLIIKGRTRDFRRIKATILALHDYEVPEIVSIRISKGSDDYLRWIRNVTSKRP